MKNIQNKIIALFFVALTSPFFCFSQESSTLELDYGVHIVYPPLSNSKAVLKEVETLVDLNPYYKPSWIREFISVEVMAFHDGKMKKAVNQDNTLSKEQKEVINGADIGTEVSVDIQYIPENNLIQNDQKDFHFTLTFDPENEAKYPGGQQALNDYLKKNTIDKIPANSFGQYQLAAVKFTIDEEGHITNPHIFWSSEDEQVDKLLLETVCNMPQWQPATYANGKKAKQEFAFTVGDMKSCVVNLINIRQDQ